MWVWFRVLGALFFIFTQMKIFMKIFALISRNFTYDIFGCILNILKTGNIFVDSCIHSEYSDASIKWGFLC